MILNYLKNYQVLYALQFAKVTKLCKNRITLKN